MKILNEINDKNVQQDKNTTDVSIGITDDRDDARKFKFKRPMMLKIFIPLCIVSVSTILICILSLTNNNYVITFDDNNKYQGVLHKNILSYPQKFREKRQLEDCEDCNEETDDIDLKEAVLRCKKNIEKKLDCCELYKKLKELNKLMENVKKDFNLYDIPCKHYLENEDEDKKKSSSSSSSSESKNKEDKSKAQEENAAEEIENNNESNTDKEHFQDYDDVNKNIEKVEETTKIYENEEDRNYDIKFKINSDNNNKQEENFNSQQYIPQQVNEYTTDRIEIETTSDFYESYSDQINTNSIDIANENIVPTTITNQYNNFDITNNKYKQDFNSYDDVHETFDENGQDFATSNIAISTSAYNVEDMTQNYNDYDPNIAPSTIEQNQNNYYDRNTQYSDIDSNPNIAPSTIEQNQNNYYDRNAQYSDIESNPNIAPSTIEQNQNNYYDRNAQYSDIESNPNIAPSTIEQNQNNYYDRNAQYSDIESNPNIAPSTIEQNQNNYYDRNAQYSGIESNPNIAPSTIEQNQNNYYDRNAQYSDIESNPNIAPSTIEQNQNIYYDRNAQYSDIESKNVYNEEQNADNAFEPKNYSPEKSVNEENYKSINRYDNDYEEQQNYDRYKNANVQENFVDHIATTPQYKNQEYFQQRSVNNPDTKVDNQYQNPQINNHESKLKKGANQNQDYDLNVKINSTKRPEVQPNIQPNYNESNRAIHLDTSTKEVYHIIDKNNTYDYNNGQLKPKDIITSTQESKHQKNLYENNYESKTDAAEQKHYYSAKIDKNYEQEPHKQLNKLITTTDMSSTEEYYDGNFDSYSTIQTATTKYNQATELSTMQSNQYLPNYDEQNYENGNEKTINRKYEENEDKFNYEDTENQGQGYDVNINIKVHNSKERILSTTLESVIHNNFEDNTKTNNFFNNDEEDIYTSNKDENNQDYTINQEQNYNVNVDAKRSTTIESVTQQNYYEANSEDYGNNQMYDNNGDINYEQNNNNEEQIYDDNINTNVDNYEHKITSTASQSVNQQHYEDHSEANRYLNKDNEDMYYAKKEENSHVYAAEDNNDKIYANKNQNQEHFYDPKAEYSTIKTVTVTSPVQSVYQQQQYENNFEQNYYSETSSKINNDAEITTEGKEFFDQLKEMNANVYTYPEQITETYIDSGRPFVKNIITQPSNLYDVEKQTKNDENLNYDNQNNKEIYNENIYENQNYNEENVKDLTTYDEEKQTKNDDNLNYDNQNNKEIYNENIYENQNYNEENVKDLTTYDEEKQTKNNDNLNYDTQNNKEIYNKNIYENQNYNEDNVKDLTTYDEEKQTKNNDNLNYDTQNNKEIYSKNIYENQNYNEDNVKDLTTKQIEILPNPTIKTYYNDEVTESNYYGNDYNNNQNFHEYENLEENNEHLYAAEEYVKQSTTDHEYLPAKQNTNISPNYKENNKDSYGNNNNNHDFHMYSHEENPGNVYKTEENNKQLPTTELEDFAINYKTVTSPTYEENDESYIVNYENNQDENYDINVKIEEKNEKPTAEYIKTTTVSSTEPNHFHYEKELKKSNYHKNENELKPEQLFKESTVAFEHNDNIVKYDETIPEDDNSIDYYTDSQGNIEEYAPEQKEIILEPQTVLTTEELKYHNYQKSLENVYENGDGRNTNYNSDTNSATLPPTTKIEKKYTIQEQTTTNYNHTIKNNPNTKNVQHFNQYNIKQTPNEWNSNKDQENNNYEASMQKEISESKTFNKIEVHAEHILESALEKNLNTTKSEDNNEEKRDIKSKENKSDINDEQNIKFAQDDLKTGAQQIFPQIGDNEKIVEDRIQQILSQNKPPEEQEELISITEKINTSNPNLGQFQPRQDNGVNDIRIVNQNPIAQRFQNIQNSGTGNSKFDNIFQLPPIETSKASQQLTVNTNMMPMCFYGIPSQNGPVLRQPGYESQLNPFSMPNTAYGAFGYPQMFQNSLGQQYNYYNSLMSHQKFSQANLLNQNNPYFCTYVPSSSLQFPPISGIQEFRNIENKNFRLPEDVDDKSIPKDWFPELMNSNKSRSSTHCLPGEKGCFDGKQCIKHHHWCDGIVHCIDKSDELGCPCKTRVEKNRLCDGYFDCPNGEDELGCFGCSSSEFCCDDWSERHKAATCVPLHERCDGIPQCKTGKDEMDCSLLTNAINVHQTYAVSKSSGYLHRNFKGSWFPVCSNTDSWVLEACLAEVGPQATFPLVHMLPVPNDYTGQFLTALPNKKAQFLKSCMGGEAVYVICPPIPCGTRLLPPPNHFRRHEVDTSNEEDFLPFVNRLRRFTDEFHKFDHHPSILSSNDVAGKKHHATLDLSQVHQHIDLHDDNELSWEEQERRKRGETRVVGGKPSQPTSWPWVVAIYRDGIFHCGGVLMSELWVITAAHCVDLFWQHYYEIQAGMLRRFSYSPMEQNRVVSNVIGHQMYDRANMKNDLALLKVGTPFQFNRWVRPVCLPSESSAGPNWMWGPTPGTICTAVGWGATVEHGPDPDHMREVEVPILAICKHREDREGQEICAGYLEGGRDACQGDSGGPLLCRNPLAPSQWYVAGIVSHGEGCARPNEPGAYTRVSLYLNWIARSILDENLPKRKPIQKCPGTLCLGTHRCISKKRRCDKTIDCLVGDDEIDCPKNDFRSLIKHAFDNMILFATNNVTTEQPEDQEEILRVHEENRNEHEENRNDPEENKVTIAPENESTTWSTFKDDHTMDENKDITTPPEQISDITSTPTTTSNIETPNTSITPSTLIPDDTISETTTAELTTIMTSIAEIPIINDPRIVLNTNDEINHKTQTTEIKSITETSTASDVDDFTEIYINASKSPAHQMPSHFECRKMLQLIPMSRRCDNVFDCEDGTDEVRCSCRGYLFASHPNAICDGVIDCTDGSDEKNCINCPDTHFHCHLSQQCIPKLLQCNHVPDCFFSEDEWDCFALTNGSYIKYDTDERPELRGKGVMSFSFSGKWFPLCNSNWIDSAHDVAGDMCAYLGFSGYQKYFEIEIKQDSLEILPINATSLTRLPSTNETCRGLYVKCSNSLSDTGDMKKIYTAHQSGANTFKEVLMSPWNAGIYVDGVFVCSGTLIDKSWVITSRTCLHHIHLHINYTTVMLGTGRGHLNVVGPHEQIRLVSEMDPIIVTDILLLKLQMPVTFTRYVRPLYIRNINNGIVSDRETCIVVGEENDSFMQVVVLKPVLEKCMRGKRCFKRVTPLPNCNDVTSTWGGTIVCLSETGWYPAAVYYDQKGICGFRTITEYTSIRNLKTRIIAAMNKRDFPIAPPDCNGIRCTLGQCVSPSQICDGISDCRDGSDETQEICDQKNRKCSATNTCDCAPSELKCHNGRCVSKSAFCDRNNDCGDWSDEPVRCNCSAYLNLVAPHRLCDGVSNCRDKSDESPRMCDCREDSFKCGKSAVCIPNDWVCDGDFDCPDKEDELFCLALRAPQEERDGVGEVVLRSFGMWHSYCIRDKPLTTPDLLEICTDLGHNTAHAAIVNKTFPRSAQDIIIENFSIVRFNEHIMMFLKGDHPTVRLEDSDKCERLYIECTPP